jgi:hypothetical protein
MVDMGRRTAGEAGSRWSLWAGPIATAALAAAVCVAPLWAAPPKSAKTAARAADKSEAAAAKSDSKAKPAKKGEDKPAEADDAKTPPTFTLKEAYTTGSNEVLVGYINEKIRAGWVANNAFPSPVADDAEWLRRVYLDIVGHIPPVEELEAFISDKSKSKRSQVIDRLLDDPGYVRQQTTIWTTLLIGRGDAQQRINRSTLNKFLRESFAKNRPWSEVVYDLVSAEGPDTENGAATFLMSHLNDGAVPATAITARLFMGTQVQCTQCHNHPFNEWKQNAFWEMNSFFKQARKIEHQKYNAKTGRMDFDYAELASMEFSGPVYFEKRNGLMQVAYPKYEGKEVDPGPEVNRRKELAKLMIEGDNTLIAKAMVNRMWGHFFGYGFTKPIDDMGPHNPASHPELLDRLGEEFVKSKYDLKQLVRWICNSEAYQLTSQFNKRNERDNPAAGETALFSHLYVKSMSAEQLYDSLIIATDAHKSGRSSWEQSEKQRQEWMQQFVLAFGTDENDESTTFNGTIPQALMMMNGDLVQNAISEKKGSYLNSVLTDNGNERSKVRHLYMSALSRAPNAKEVQNAAKLIGSSKNPLEGYQDLFWALLNSNEFIFIH